ncbi:MAG: 3'(2'),5'-bisphosphate nucleotidase [Rhodothermales bacterium]|nr:3'(2'),5'-bisphosphate nucleotidase [Rhodothermales bacterium]
MADAYRRELEIAVEAVREAAQLCRAVQRELDPGVLEKKDRSPVTVADFGSQALVCRRLRAAFPDDPIIAEEDATALRADEGAALREQVVRRVHAVRPDAAAADVLRWIDYGNAHAYTPRFWTLDPIDGTKGFLRGEQYAVALALIVEGRVVAAALACPNLPSYPEAGAKAGGVYAAVRSGGAFRLPLEGAGSAEPVRVSTLADPAEARFCESVVSAHSSHGDAAAVAERLGIAAPPVRLDSQAKYAVVARGQADIYLRLPTRKHYVENIWDHAAGALVVEEAGGRITDVTGTPLDFGHGPKLARNRGVVVTNGPLHEAVVGALGAVGVA